MMASKSALILSVLFVFKNINSNIVDSYVGKAKAPKIDKFDAFQRTLRDISPNFGYEDSSRN